MMFFVPAVHPGESNRKNREEHVVVTAVHESQVFRSTWVRAIWVRADWVRATWVRST